MKYNSIGGLMPVSKPNASTRERRDASAQRVEHAAFAAAVGRLVRLARAKRGATRRQLAQDSGASERYLAQIESGQGNPSRSEEHTSELQSLRHLVCRL